MSTPARRLAVIALAVAGWLAQEATALAQFTLRTIPSAAPIYPGNPFFLPGPGTPMVTNLAQAEYQARIRLNNNLFRFGGGFPGPGFPGPGFPGPGFPGGAPFNPIIPPISPLYNPYNPIGGTTPFAGSNLYNPIGSAYTPGVTNPYTPITGGYDPTGTAGYADAYSGAYETTGGTLRGTADVMRAQGAMWTSAEQARLMREQAYQARLESIRKKFDLDAYIKANTPSWSEIEAQRAVVTLKRIQDNASPGEVSSGRSLNILVNDLGKFPGKKLAGIEIPMINQEILEQLNVAGPGSVGSLGILRNKSLPPWPTVLQEILTPTQMRSLEEQIFELKKSAAAGAADPNKAKELRKALEKAIDELGRRISDISTSDYLNGKRFLTDLDQARISLERGDLKAQVEFNAWAKGGKSAQELAEYIARTGIKIAPSTLADEAAYRAVHSALVSLDVQMHAQFASASPGPDYPKE